MSTNYIVLHVLINLFAAEIFRFNRQTGALLQNRTIGSIDP
jgi:hypothetical protein